MIKLFVRNNNIMFLRNKPGWLENLGKGVKNVFNKVTNNIWKRRGLTLAVLSLYRNHPIDFLCKSMEWFVCNSNISLKWQRGCMIKVIVCL